MDNGQWTMDDVRCFSVLFYNDFAGLDQLIACGVEGVEVQLSGDDVNYESFVVVMYIYQDLHVADTLVHLHKIRRSHRYIAEERQVAVLIEEREGDSLTDGTHKQLRCITGTADDHVIGRSVLSGVERLDEVNEILLP